MVDTSPGAGGSGSHRKANPTVITDARTGSSREMASREKQYVITMAFRMACFISIFFVDGWLRWVVLAGAVFLPFIAVLFANQANEKTVSTQVQQAEPLPATALTVGPPLPEVIEGELDDDDEGWSRGERVA
ncbi:MAG TPA: DUF3099 domain-containing protein [Propionibacteriaceae bacterium]